MPMLGYTSSHADLPALLALCLTLSTGAYRHYCMFSNTYNRVLENPKASWKAPASMWRLELEVNATPF